MRRKVGENERRTMSGLSGHREGKFRSRTGLLNALVTFILLNGFARQADCYVYYFPILL